MTLEKKLTYVEKKSLALLTNMFESVSDFENIDEVIEYLQNGVVSFNSLLSLCFLLKKGTELTEGFKKQMENADDKSEVYEAAMAGLTTLVKKFMAEKN